MGFLTKAANFSWPSPALISNRFEDRGKSVESENHMHTAWYAYRSYLWTKSTYNVSHTHTHARAEIVCVCVYLKHRWIRWIIGHEYRIVVADIFSFVFWLHFYENRMLCPSTDARTETTTRNGVIGVATYEFTLERAHKTQATYSILCTSHVSLTRSLAVCLCVCAFVYPMQWRNKHYYVCK